ncbi:MAG TPA: SBBP repeat-containing protein, partial [Acidobacteriaceae bacterium]|nr:SBBP repeat-containing protein [Acidobacteriaceae bacterium]
MNIDIECQNSLKPANGPSSFRQVTKQYAMAILALLALLCGAGASAQTAAYSGSTGTFDATDYTAPQGIATDASGDVFIANNGGTPTVYEMTLTGPGTYSAPVALPNPTPGYTFLRGVTIDSNGNLWVADNANGTGGQVYELAYLSGSFGTPTKVGSGWTGPWQIAADASGNVFVTDNSANSITEISGGTATVVNTGSVSAPRGIAVDSTEDLFVVDANLGQVVKLAPPYTSAVSVNLTGFQGPGDIAIDASGNIWVAAYSANLVRELTYASGYATILSWGSGLSGPLAVWPETGGNLLVSDDGDHSIRQIATGSINVGMVAVNATSTTQTLAFTFTGASSTTIEAPQVLTGGATGQDFADAGTGTCTTANGAGNPYASGATCTVVVNLKPKYAGPRNGAVELLNSSGTVLATALVYGTGSGPEVAFPGNTTITALGGGFSQPFGVALDGSGSVYVADKASTSIAKVPTGCAASSCVTTLGGGFVNPTGVAVDGAGNVYVADQGNSAVKEVPAGCVSSACVTTLGGGFGSPLGVAVDGSGNVYVADNSKDAVDEMPAGCTSASCVTALGAGFGSPTGVAVDGSGNVYVTGSGSVKEMTPGCVSDLCVTALGGGFNTPIGVTVDGGGNVYVGDYGTNHVNEIPVGCTSSTCVATLGSGFSAPAGVALDGAGNLYVGDSGNIAVKELSLATPPSLSFATTNTGSQSSDSPQAVTLSNIGNAPLSLPVPGTGTNPSVSDDFTLDASTTCPEVTSSSSAGTLAAGGSCSLEVDFSPRTIGAISGAVVLTDNNLNASPSAMQSIGLSGTATSLIAPYVQVNGGAWQETDSVTVNVGDTVNLGGQPLTGTWSWTGPNGFTSTSRVINAVALPSGTTVYTANYTSTGGDTSRLDFTITVNPTAITPYLQVNGGAWQQTASVTVNPGTTVNLGGQQLSTGTWSWSGPNGFTAATRVINAIPLPSPANSYTLTYTNASGVTSTQLFTVTVNSTAIVPYLQVNGGAWQQAASVAVNAGDAVTLGGQQLSTGTWSWVGPNGYTAATRVINAVPLTSPTNIYTLTYTNASGVTSTQAFTVTVNSTTILPYVQVNGGAWQQTASVTVSAGSTVNLGGQQLSTGTWSWTGPSGFTAATRVISAPLTSPTDSYTLTYTNAAGVNSTQTFTVTVNSTPIVPSIQVNGGAWQQTASATVYAGDTVNLEGQLL